MMTCREVDRVLDRFLDGEIEAPAMRSVALHVTRCPPCEAILRRLEQLQDLVADTFAEAVAEIDFTHFWPGVAERLHPLRRSWLGAPALALARPGAAAAGVLAGALLVAAFVWRLFPSPELAVRPNNQARIDSLASEAGSVALLSERATNTTVIWIVDDGDDR